MRYERKYILEHIPLVDIQQIIKLHPAAFRLAFPARQVNNIYFDTVNLSAYSDNVKGIANRSKFRIRWYGNEPKNGTLPSPVLEEKVKRGELGYKNSQKLANLKWTDLHNIPQIQPYNLHPTLVNSYYRHYYVSFDERFRITIDEQLEFAAYNVKTIQNQQPILHPFQSNKIIEIKYEETDSPKADFISQYLPFRPTKHSKYVIGVESCIS